MNLRESVTLVRLFNYKVLLHEENLYLWKGKVYNIMVLNCKLKKFSTMRTICDETGNPVYYAKINISSARIVIFNQLQEELAYIERRYYKPIPEFNIFIGDDFQTTMVRKFPFILPNYELKGINLSVIGDFFSFDHQVLKGGNRIMSVSHNRHNRSEASIIVEDPKDALLAIAILLVIDY